MRIFCAVLLMITSLKLSAGDFCVLNFSCPDQLDSPNSEMVYRYFNVRIVAEELYNRSLSEVAEYLNNNSLIIPKSSMPNLKSFGPSEHIFKSNEGSKKLTIILSGSSFLCGYFNNRSLLFKEDISLDTDLKKNELLVIKAKGIYFEEGKIKFDYELRRKTV